jgi:hypothetical protein
LHIPLPALPSAELKATVSAASDSALPGLFDNYSEKLARQALNGMWDVLADLNLEESMQWGQEVTQGGLRADLADVELHQSGVVHLSGDAYTAIETFLTTGENTKLGSLHVQLKGSMERVRGDDGKVDW